jgi:hypothetical protein
LRRVARQTPVRSNCKATLLNLIKIGSHHHQAIDQANISSGDPKNRSHCFLIRKIIGMGLDSMTPALLEQKAGLLLGGKASISSAQSIPHDPQNCTEFARRFLGFTGKQEEVLIFSLST